MIIKQIKLENFRQFKGEHTIEFSTDNEKNVTVILGSNTSGKTTIVSAFIWGLYGVNNFKDKILLNNRLSRGLTNYSTHTVSVEITLVHDKKEYIIYRSQKYSKTSTGDSIRGNAPELKVSYIDENGETTAVLPADCQSIIEGILPQALSDYFFFDGERFKDITQKSNVVAAVRGLMGLDVYSNGMDHLDPTRTASVVGKLNREIDTGNDTEANRRKSQISKYKDDLEMFKNKTPQILEQVDYWTTKKEEYAQIIKDNEDVKTAQDKKERLEREEKYLKNQIVTSEERLIEDFNKNAYKFFALPLIKKAIAVLDSAKEEGAGIPEMHSNSIDYILKRGYCICGCDLTKNQGAVEHIQKEQRLLPPQHIGTSVRIFKQNIENAHYDCDRFSDNVVADYHTWLESQKELDYKARELKEISEQIKGYSDVKKIEEKYQDADSQLRRYLSAKEGNHDAIVRLEAQIAENEKEIGKYIVANEKNQKIQKYIDYATALYDWFRAYYDKEEIAVKEELLASINDNFSKMYHGNRVIVMDDNYKITPVLTGDKVELDKSEGLKTVTSFSFVTGLVELARRRANAVDEDNPEMEQITEPYPIVMDAAFSNTDEIHTENITARLPEVAEQVIMFVMDKDWNVAKRKLERHLGAKYQIEKIDNQDDNSALRREM